MPLSWNPTESPRKVRPNDPNAEKLTFATGLIILSVPLPPFGDAGWTPAPFLGTPCNGSQ